jgi:hypothetical protein
MLELPQGYDFGWKQVIQDVVFNLLFNKLIFHFDKRVI